jgi:hypothetical protein
LNDCQYSRKAVSRLGDDAPCTFKQSKFEVHGYTSPNTVISIQVLGISVFYYKIVDFILRSKFLVFAKLVTIISQR